MADLPGNAWIAGRALDYLLDPRYACPVEKGRICIIGHSRYGKQSLIAAALDERITSVVARSPGSPGSCPYRFTSRNTFAETSVDFPGDWFLKSLHTYYGRENELPIDAHGWLGLIAPRRCLIHTAHNDGCEPTLAVERAYQEGRNVYRLLGKPENLRVLYRPGGHNPITDEHRRQNFDWFDLSFGRGTAQQSDFPEEFIHKFDWENWKSKLNKEDLNAPFAEPIAKSDRALRRKRILWALGQKPEKIAWDGQYTFLTKSESEMMTHDRWRARDTARIPVSFGANVRGNIYYNPKIKTPAPVVIWLHPYSYHSGYNEGYGVQGTTVYHRLAQEGFVVLAFDQCGFGLRLLEGRDFYQAYPKWSRLGRMVHDVCAAVDFLVDGKGKAQSTMPAVDKGQVYVLGYSVGGMVGLYAAALDERIAGVASFCGFTPLRTDTDDKPTGGIRRLWEWHALQPLLGTFHGHEHDIHYDFNDVLALVAPRPCLVYNPKRDREADFDEVARCVDRARKAWPPDAAGALTHETPDDINRFQADQQKAFLHWYEQIRASGQGDGR
jgi:pimeloyl-ACP methyl ester carboxylesterase